MSAPAAIQATFADWRTIKGRKQLQLHFEVPIELQAQVLTYLGAPDPTNPKWCAIALLDLSKVSKPASEPKERRRFDELPPAQQAGIMSNDPLFWRFLEEEHAFYRPGEGGAADFIRAHCSVSSRSELSDANKFWRDLKSNFGAWKAVG